MDEGLYHEWVVSTFSHLPNHQSSMCIIESDFGYVNDINMTQVFPALLFNRQVSIDIFRETVTSNLFSSQKFRVRSLSSQEILIGLIVPKFESTIFDKPVHRYID